MADTRTAYRTCPLCEATCGLELTIVDGSVTRIRGDQADVFSAGFICPKGTTLGRFHEDPDRLRRPLVKTESGHVEADWDEAYRVISDRALPLLAQDRDRTAIYLGNPTVHSLDAMLFGRAVITALGTPSVYSASTVDQRPREVASGLLYGLSVTIPVPDVDRTDTLLLLGANPYVSNGSLATAPDWPGRIEALQARGGTLIVVDPVRTRTAEQADLHLAIRPTTDALLLAAIATELVRRDVHRPDPADVDSLDRVIAGLAGFTPDAVADRVGIPASEISDLAERLAESERPCVYARLGTTVTPFGTTASWLVDVVNALLGALDRPGGAMFPTNPAGSKNTRSEDPHGREQRLGRRRTSVSNRPIELGEHPVAVLSEEIEAGHVGVLVTIAGNPVLSCPDSQRLDEALEDVDFMVSVDCYLNETTRHADVILPPPSHLQKSHFDLAFGNLSIRNVANYSPPVLPLDEGELPEWEVIARLAAVLGGASGDRAGAELVDGMMFDQAASGVLASDRCPPDLDEESVRASSAGRTGPDRILDVLLRSGPWGDWFGHGEGLSLDRLSNAPHGVDLGPLEPRLPGILSTPSGRPEFDHPDLMSDLDRLRTHVAEPNHGHDRLELVNRRTLRSNNSWMHNLEILVKGKPRCTAMLNPDDASARGIADGDLVRIESAAGLVEVPAEVTDAVRPGVVCMPHGWGHDRDGTRLRVASAHAGANVNRLTPTDSIDPLSGTSQLTGIPVEVAPVG